MILQLSSLQTESCIFLPRRPAARTHTNNKIDKSQLNRFVLKCKLYIFFNIAVLRIDRLIKKRLDTIVFHLQQ